MCLKNHLYKKKANRSSEHTIFHKTFRAFAGMFFYLKQFMNSNERYNSRGVSASKEDVHQAIKNIDKGLYAKAFCKIVPDYLSGSDEHCIIMHADGAGTKSSLAYTYWKETGNLNVWKGMFIKGSGFV